MKMRKSTWLLLVLALAAIFLVAGCAPNTTTPTPPENGEEPTPPPADKECPKVVSTVVSKMYAAKADDPNFQIKITFDENISSSCIENPANWTIKVANPGRQDTEIIKTDTPGVQITGITVDGKVVTVKARVEEAVTYKVKYEKEEGGGVTTKTGTFEYTFPGLICNKADAKAYAAGYTLPDGAILVSSTPAEPTYADKVTWKLECAVYDDLGNVCCDFEGEACCVEPYCEKCPPDWCDFTEPGACK